MKEQITYDIFDKIDIRLGTVISVKKNEKARKPSLVIEVDFGEEIGIKHSFLDCDVIDGKQYTYTITAYDRGLKPIFFEKIGDSNTSREQRLKNLIKVLESQGFKIKNKK